MASDTFQDFCQAWTSRFPNSELPAAWEEDVRANLAKHKTKVGQLREELDKEEMYVEYLEKLLSDIELHRHKLNGTGKQADFRLGPHEEDRDPDNDDRDDDAVHEEDDHELEIVRGSRSSASAKSTEGENPRQRFLEDQCALHTRSKASLRASLHLDLVAGGAILAPNTTAEGDGEDDARANVSPSGRKLKPSQFVTVINVKSPDGGNGSTNGESSDGRKKSATAAAAAAAAASRLTYTKTTRQAFDLDEPRNGRSERSSLRSWDPNQHHHQRQESQESLNSISSPLSPLGSPGLENPLLFPREAPASPRDSALIVGGDSSSSDPSPTGTRTKPDPPERSVSIRSQQQQQELLSAALTDTKSNSSAEDLHSLTQSRGRPDGGEMEEGNSSLPSPTPPHITTVKDLRTSWENKPPISAKPVDRKQRRGSSPPARRKSSPGSPPQPRRSLGGEGRKDSDSSSRGRMGSPSGKSHDSSDSEHSWGRLNDSDHVASPGQQRRRISGETRLDRLVRRPSGESRAGSSLQRPGSLAPPPPPALPKPRRATTAAARKDDEPYYDMVASEEAGDGGGGGEDEGEEEDEYDNHLLYEVKGKKKSSSASGSREARTSTGSLSRSELLSSSTDTTTTTAADAANEEEEEETNYVNIQYFLHHTRRSEGGSNSGGLLDRQDSIDPFDDEDVDGRDSESEESSAVSPRSKPSSDVVPSASSSSTAEAGERIQMCRHILTSILESESIYLECLSVCLQYMKAMKVTLSTPSPVIPKEDFEIIFYKVPELYEFHHHFHDSLKKQVDRWSGEEKIGHHFKMLAQQTRIYAQYLGNYPKALDTLHKCTQLHPQFADLTYSIKLRTLKGQQQGQSVSLEDLLHKPVARVQKNSLSLQDLLKHTPEGSADHTALSESLHLIQNFLNEYNLEHRGELYPHHERNQRHLVKNSFIVELTEGVRKLRHLFLFNDVLVCAKYKAANRGEKFTFQLKWHIPLAEALIVEEPSSEPREARPANLVQLKTSTTALRDTIAQLEREEEWKGRNKARAGEKQKKQLAELEAQLVLASPHLLFQVASKSGRTYSFYLSSEYERSQWVEALRTLQANLPPNTSQAYNLSMVELQSWISSCRKFLKTNMGSFLMRSARDEPLLIGDLHLVINSLSGLTRPSDLFIVAEVDSYGHFFRVLRTKVQAASLEPAWNEEFMVDLEGSENLRLLVYQESEGTVLRGKASLELSRSWLSTEYTQHRVSLGDLVLTCQMRFQPFEETLRRVPQAKPTGLFKSPIQQTTKREKRAVPFIITSAVREVERRGITEVGVYRVSGSSADMLRLRKAYESNPYEAEQLLKECDIHSVAGILKQFLRDLPECIFTTAAYNRLFEAYAIQDQELRSRSYLHLFSQLPQNPNQACIVFLIEHLVRVSQMESQNKMSLHNLATVFGPTMLHAGQERDKKGADLLASSTVDVMAQSGILHFFLARRARGEPIQIQSL